MTIIEYGARRAVRRFAWSPVALDDGMEIQFKFYYEIQRWCFGGDGPFCADVWFVESRVRVLPIGFDQSYNLR